MDSRAQTNGIIGFLAILTIGALLTILFQPAVNAILDAALASTSNEHAATVIEQRRQIFGYLTAYSLFVGVLMLIARGVLQSRSPG